MEGITEITNVFIQKKIASGKQYCVRLYKAGPNRDQPPEEADKTRFRNISNSIVCDYFCSEDAPYWILCRI